MGDNSPWTVLSRGLLPCFPSPLLLLFYFVWCFDLQSHPPLLKAW
uniref:Uncharacterized protein MANES_10G031800 n=1 Tax=Rhizophora mucronata TaxID=61149 RepID=A0A2P2KN60_RHIMU